MFGFSIVKPPFSFTGAIVVIVNCATDRSGDFMSIVISESKRTACRQES